MKTWMQLVILVGILLGSSILLTIQRQGISLTWREQEKNNFISGAETLEDKISFEMVRNAAEEAISHFPDVKIFGEEFEIREIREENLYGYKFYRVVGRIGDGEIIFYLSKDLKNVVFHMDSVKILRFMSIDEIRRMTEEGVVRKSERPDVKLFIMSFCPYGNQMELLFEKIIEKIGDKIDFEPVYIYSRSNAYREDSCVNLTGEYYCSLHGINELWQNLREKAIYEMYGAKRWMEYVKKVDEKCDLRNIQDCWKEVAREVNIPIEEVENYVEGNMEELIKNDYMLSQKYNAWGSPTLYVNDVLYRYSRDTSHIFKYICASFKEKPDECGEDIEGSTVTPVGTC